MTETAEEWLKRKTIDNAGKMVYTEDALLAVKKAREERTKEGQKAIEVVKLFFEDEVIPKRIEKSLDVQTEEIFEGLENIFLKNKGDSVANFHTLLIKDYEGFKAEFLQGQT